MKGLLIKMFLAVAVIFSLAHLSACVSGGTDTPFVFGDGSSGGVTPDVNPLPPTSCNPACNADQICDSGVCITPSATCDAAHPCPDGQTCQDGACVPTPPPVTCTQDPSICPATFKCVNGTCACDPTKTTCGPVEGCRVDYDAKITLRIDDDYSSGHYDSPSTCCEYGGDEALSSCSTNPNIPEGYLQAPSETRDLYCCNPTPTSERIITEPSPLLPSQIEVPGAEIFCDSKTRHGDTPELAATRWPSAGNKKIKFTFFNFQSTNASQGTCQLGMNVKEFPVYDLGNTVLDSSMRIDAGAGYRSIPMPSCDASTHCPTGQVCQSGTCLAQQNLNVTGNGTDVVGRCEYRIDESGQVQVNITELPLRFLAQLYAPYTACLLVRRNDNGPGGTPQLNLCAPQPFLERYHGETAESYQIIPGFRYPTLNLTTTTQTQDPVNPANQKPMSIDGQPIKMDADGKSRMRLVTAFALPGQGGHGIPDDVAASERNDDTGGGQLLAVLHNALMTAEFVGTVTNSKGNPIKTLADLTTDCGTAEPTATGNIDLGLSAQFKDVSQNDMPMDLLEVTGDITKPDQPFTTVACATGLHQGDDCSSTTADRLPFAKEAADPAVPALQPLFQTDGILTIQNKSSSTVSIALRIPTTAGTFRILNASTLQNITLAPGNSTSLQVRFEPQATGNGCAADPSDSNFVVCEAPLSISVSHDIVVTLKGRARVPAAVIKVEELSTSAPNNFLSTILPISPLAPVDFGQASLRIDTLPKLFRVSNMGVRDLQISDLPPTLDPKLNFRLGSAYQGPDFVHREWISNRPKPWTVPPGGTNDLFFFVNYGPFGQLPAAGCDGDPQLRCDTGKLNLTSTAGQFAIDLKGTAKSDTRGTLALLIQDETKFGLTGTDVLTIGTGTAAEHLYLPTEQSFSYREDSSPLRTVYLVNTGKTAVDHVMIKGVRFNDTTGKYTFVKSDFFTQNEGCLASDTCNINLSPSGETESYTETCGTGTPCIRLGSITFNATPNDAVQSISEAILSVTTATAPIIGGNSSTDNSSTQITYKLRGANGIPVMDHPYSLVIHRLLAGYETKLSDQFQRSLVVSTATKGVLKRINQQVGNSNYSPDAWKDVFRLPQRLTLNPVTGEARLGAILTPVDPNQNSPARPATLDGIRLFNALGSYTGETPWGQNEFYVQCANSPGPHCSFFYLYIGDWASATSETTCGGSTPKVPIAPYQSSTGGLIAGSQAARDAWFAKVLRPDIAADLNCMKNQVRDATGSFDPVTGEIILNDLAVRLFSPQVPNLGNNPVDATLRVSLTTGCVTDDRITDETARPKRLVPTDTTDEPHRTGIPATKQYNETVVGTNPMLPYVSGTSDPKYGCANRELHGRPEFQTPPDPLVLAILDNEDDSDSLNFNGFDLAGIGRIQTSTSQVAESNMYIVIKAEVGELCGPGTLHTGEVKPTEAECNQP